MRRAANPLFRPHHMAMSVAHRREVALGVGASALSALVACFIMHVGVPTTTSSVSAALALYLVPSLLFAAVASLAKRTPGLYIGATAGFSAAMVAETYIEKFQTPNNSMPGAGFLFYVLPLSLLALAVVGFVLRRAGSQQAIINGAAMFIAISGLWLYLSLSPLLSSVA